ncbi:MAG TPA: class I SAM-dependent methyltransferase [Acidimicrobiales bacterium]|nr:class I SAM-dependent methyltransferase [Acidimicrobiales bacterium]
MASRSYDIAAYGERWAAIYDDEVRPEPDAVEFLAARAGRGPALEFAVGTGRFAIPLIERGIRVDGIDSSEAMATQLRERVPRARVEIGDMASVDMGRTYPLVFLVATSLFLLLEQDDQVRCFENAARHLTKRGQFVVNTFVPQPSRFPDGQTVRASDVSDGGVSLEVAKHDGTRQRVDVQYVTIDDSGKIELFPIHLRYAWPAELDLMARIAGLKLVDRFGGWRGEPLTDVTPEHVSVYRRA